MENTPTKILKYTEILSAEINSINLDLGYTKNAEKHASSLAKRLAESSRQTPVQPIPILIHQKNSGQYYICFSIKTIRRITQTLYYSSLTHRYQLLPALV